MGNGQWQSPPLQWGTSGGLLAHDPHVHGSGKSLGIPSVIGACTPFSFAGQHCPWACRAEGARFHGHTRTAQIPTRSKISGNELRQIVFPPKMPNCCLNLLFVPCGRRVQGQGGREGGGIGKAPGGGRGGGSEGSWYGPGKKESGPAHEGRDPGRMHSRRRGQQWGGGRGDNCPSQTPPPLPPQGAFWTTVGGGCGVSS